MFRYVFAGHPPFLLIRGNEITGLPELGEPGTNLPMAALSGVQFSANEIKLNEGDKLIFYTDGLSEMPIRHRNRALTIKNGSHLIVYFRKYKKTIAEIPP